jgi:predicted nucleotide-binding protein
MNGDEVGTLKRKRARLNNLQAQFEKQDEIIKALIPRSQSWEGAPSSLMVTLADLFRQVSEALPGECPHFDPKDNDLDGLRSQIVAARSRIVDGLGLVEETLGGIASSAIPSADRRSELGPIDPRRVFVVHGRNKGANDALFSFLRAVDLDPIEWEEAITLTGQGTPYPGEALEAAFSRAGAAVVLLTGDDMARLGRRFLEPSDKEYEQVLTPQCRPNVLFEAGMAFGKHPDRTIVVSLSKTRPFSDILGRNAIDLASETWRHDLAERLVKAGCAVKTEGRRKWLQEGDFSAANLPPDASDVQARPPAHDTPSRTDPVPLPHLCCDRPTEAAKLRSTNADQQEKASDMDDHVTNGGLFVAPSPAQFEVQIFLGEEPLLRGFMIKFRNNALHAIDGFEFSVKTAESYSALHDNYRENRSFKAAGRELSSVVEAGFDSSATWLILKKEGTPQLMAAGDESSRLDWPDNDKASVQKWKVLVYVCGFRATPGVRSRIGGMDLPLIVTWDSKKNDFFLHRYKDQTTT